MKNIFKDINKIGWIIIIGEFISMAIATICINNILYSTGTNISIAIITFVLLAIYENKIKHKTNGQKNELNIK